MIKTVAVSHPSNLMDTQVLGSQKSLLALLSSFSARYNSNGCRLHHSSTRGAVLVRETLLF